jgi:hypothetical protein
MKVQVTKVWLENVELTYQVINLGNRAKKPTARISNDPVWLTEKITWFRRIKPFSDKFVKKNFPELADKLEVGENKIMDIQFRKSS